MRLLMLILVLTGCTDEKLKRVMEAATWAETKKICFHATHPANKTFTGKYCLERMPNEYISNSPSRQTP